MANELVVLRFNEETSLKFSVFSIDQKKTQFCGELEASSLVKNYEEWVQNFNTFKRGLKQPGRGHRAKITSAPTLQAKVNQRNQTALGDLSDSIDKFQAEFNKILDVSVLQHIKQLPNNNFNYLIVETQAPKLGRLPWHIWNKLESANCEVSLSFPTTCTKKSIIYNKTKLKILVVFGYPYEVDYEDIKDFFSSTNLGINI